MSDLDLTEINTLIDALYVKIEMCEASLFDCEAFFLPDNFSKLRYVCNQYEKIHQRFSHQLSRPYFLIQTTTYNAPCDIREMLDSLVCELEYFSFPPELIKVLIVDDSDLLKSLEENRSIAEKYRPFDVFYYGPAEQKKFINEMFNNADDAQLSVFNKTKDDFNSQELIKWGHKGVSGAMNMALCLSKKHADKNTWIVSLDEDMSFGCFVKTKAENGVFFERKHVYSYFHRVQRVVQQTKKTGGYDLILGASVGDYCTPALTWRVIDDAFKFWSQAKETFSESESVLFWGSFLENFPTYDLKFNCNGYCHRQVNTEVLQGEAHLGSLGLKGSATSGNHMLFSSEFLKKMPFCYYGPGRVADARFFLLVQNDKRYKYAESLSLVLSHSKRADDKAHDLFDELSEHINDEYTYLGYNFVVFYYLYTQKRDTLDLSFFQKGDVSGFEDSVVSALKAKLPLVCEKRKKLIQRYINCISTLDNISVFEDGQLVGKYNKIRASLFRVVEMLKEKEVRSDDIVLKGISLFFETVEQLSKWEENYNVVGRQL